jgi:hypothetical protein
VARFGKSVEADDAGGVASLAPDSEAKRVDLGVEAVETEAASLPVAAASDAVPDECPEAALPEPKEFDRPITINATPARPATPRIAGLAGPGILAPKISNPPPVKASRSKTAPMIRAASGTLSGIHPPQGSTL